MFDLVYDSPDFVLINKHPGVDFHRDGDHSLIEEVRARLGREELFTVHRLDKMTSGLLLFAKSSEIAAKFSKLFQKREMEKYYVAISDRKPKRKQGLIKGDMEKSRRGAWMLLRTTENPAITQFFSYSLGAGRRLYLLKPHTGKTHQLRVAMKGIGAPILGDLLYDEKDRAEKMDRGYLHAYYLAFELNGEQFEFTCVPRVGELFCSDSFVEALEKIGNPSKLSWPKL